MEHEARSCDYQSLLRDPVRGQLSHLRPHIHFCSISFSVFIPSAITFFLTSFGLGGPYDLLIDAMKQTCFAEKFHSFHTDLFILVMYVLWPPTDITFTLLWLKR
jgi:hypothetical protein